MQSHSPLDGTPRPAVYTMTFFGKLTIILWRGSQPLLAIDESPLHSHLHEILLQEMQAIRAISPREDQSFHESTTTLSVDDNSTTTTDTCSLLADDTTTATDSSPADENSTKTTESSPADDSSITTTESSPADRSLTYYFPKPKDGSKAKQKGTGGSKAKRRARGKGKLKVHHLADIPLPKAAEERLKNWNGVYQNRLGNLLEDYNGPGRARIDNERLEFWRNSKGKVQLYLVFRWAKGLKKPLLRFLKRQHVSDQADGVFQFMVEMEK